MTFLRKLFGSGGGDHVPDAPPDDSATPDQRAPADVDADERTRELDLLRSEAANRNELVDRQLRYAQYAWTPPAQGGPRRADDEESTDTTAGR